ISPGVRSGGGIARLPSSPELNSQVKALFKFPLGGALKGYVASTMSRYENCRQFGRTRELRFIALRFDHALTAFVRFSGLNYRICTSNSAKKWRHSRRKTANQENSAFSKILPAFGFSFGYLMSLPLWADNGGGLLELLNRSIRLEYL